AEDHDSNPIKIGLGKLKSGGAEFLSVHPVKTGYSAIADEWLGLNPRTHGLFVLAPVHEPLCIDRIYLDFLSRSTNAPWLWVRTPAGREEGLLARATAGRPLCWDRNSGRALDANAPDASPIMVGDHRLPDGRSTTTVFQLMAERYLDPSFSPDSVA